MPGCRDRISLHAGTADIFHGSEIPQGMDKDSRTAVLQHLHTRPEMLLEIASPVFSRCPHHASGAVFPPRVVNMPRPFAAFSKEREFCMLHH
jgi:hypothetical protein